MRTQELKLDDAITIQRRLAAGEKQHSIAADYGVNQGRISEINRGRRFPTSRRLAFPASGQPTEIGASSQSLSPRIWLMKDLKNLKVGPSIHSRPPVKAPST